MNEAKKVGMKYIRLCYDCAKVTKELNSKVQIEEVGQIIGVIEFMYQTNVISKNQYNLLRAWINKVYIQL